MKRQKPPADGKIVPLKPAAAAPADGGSREVSALIQTLGETDRRLEELTAGEVDTVSDREGRTFLLRRAQDRLRHDEAAKQATTVAALRESEARFRALIEQASDGIAVSDERRRFVLVNPRFCEMLGYSESELLGLSVIDTYAVGSVPDPRHRTMLSYLHERMVRRKDGSLFPAEISVSSIGKDSRQSIVRDVTVRKSQELRIAHLSRIHAVLSGINSAIVRVQGREQLFREACRIAVVSGGFRLAWIGMVDMAAQAIVPFSWNGENDGYVSLMPLSLGEERSLAVRAVAEREVMIANDMRQNPNPLIREEALLRGFHSMAVLPLLVDGAAVGMLALYAGEFDYFSDDEVSLLRDLAGNIAFAIDHLERQERLTVSESRFRQMADNIRDVFYLREADGSGMLYVSPAYETVWGRSREGLYADPTSWGDSIHPDDRVAARELNRQGLRAGKVDHDYRIVRPDGTVRWIESRGFPVYDDAGRIVRIAGVASDITDRKESTRRIAYLNRVYAVLSGINTLIVRAGSRDELFTEACRIAVETGGFRMAMIAMRDPAGSRIVPVASAGKEEVLLAAVRERLASTEGSPNTMVARALREKKPVVSNQSESDPGVVFQAMYAGSSVRSMAVLPIVVAGEAVGVLALYAGEVEFFHEEEMKLLEELAGDVAFAIDHIAKQERLHYLAYHDVLTGLSNRALFHERLQESVVSATVQRRALALVLMDIERFKTVNDTLGRPAGDALLKEVAARMCALVADNGRLARIDSDHFAIMVTDVRTAEDLGRLIERRFLEIFAPPFRTGEVDQRLSAKIGVAMFPDDGADADSLFRNAEAALKNAKTGGERCLFYTPAMNERVAEKLSMENRLRQAIEKKEFVLHYQPKVGLVSGKLTGAEALIRWNDPRAGLVAPGSFIPLLEETGLINEVGRWALQQAISDQLRWRAAGLQTVRISVNVSPLQLRNHAFIADIQQAVGIDPHAAAGLELEITESLIMEDVGRSIASLKAIRDMGVSIAIDDFGTGFSSLAYLSRLPADTLKIDRSFVVGMTAGPEGLALVSTIITLAHSMKLKVVAEGVETEEQQRLLRLLGCDEMQGYLFSRPVPGDTFETKFLAP